jgi:hypothetical protein
MFADPLRSLEVRTARPRPDGPPGWAEVSQHSYRDGVHELTLLARGIEGEIEAVAQGPAEFALVEEEPLLLLCHRFGDAIPWSPATFCPLPPSPWDRSRAPAEESLEARAILHVRLTPSDGGTELARRNLTLSLEFTRALHAAIRDQSRFSPDPVELKRALQRLRRSFPTTEALIGRATARTIGSR